MTNGVRTLPGGGVTSARGFRAGAVYCGLKTPGEGKLDLGLLVSDRPCAVAGTFTTNKVAAAPVVLDRRRVQAGRARGVVFNAGNANAATGERGLRDAERMTALAAQAVGAGADEFLVCSTGVIGVPLPMDKIEAGLPRVELSADGGAVAARAIMTTDTHPKEIAVEVDLGGTVVRIGGMCKGAGMIHPNMATMLAFLTTDAAAEPAFLRAALAAVVDDSFNLVSVDGDTSTNDTVLLLANGAAGNPPLTADSPGAGPFRAALRQVCIHLAREIAGDGEGATHLVEVSVTGAPTREDARRVARAVVSSSLVKAMVYGLDPNWGRVACAAGYSGADLDPDRMTISIGDVVVFRNGLGAAFDPAAAQDQMRGPEVKIALDLGAGDVAATAWGCDLTEGYVVENSAYTT